MVSSPKTLHVFPDARGVEQALLKACEESDGFVDASYFLNWHRFVQLLEPARLLGRRPCTLLSGRLLILSLLPQVPDNPLGAFTQEPSFARQALSLVSELKAGGCRHDDFRRAVSSLPGRKRSVALLLADIYARYEKALEENQLADREDLLTACIDRLDNHPLPDILQRVSAVEIHDLYDVSPLRLRVVESLARRLTKENKQLFWHLPASGNELIDATVDSVLKHIEAQWGEYDVFPQKAYVDTDGQSAALARNMFRDEHEMVDVGDAISFVSAANPQQEASEIALGVRRWLDAGVPPEKVAVAFRDLGPDAERVAAALSDVGIACSYRIGAPLTSTTLGRLALDLPTLVDDSYPAEKLARYLDSRYFRRASSFQAGSAASVFQKAGVRNNLIGKMGQEGAYAVRLRNLASRAETLHPKLARQALSVAENVKEFMRCVETIPREGTLSVLWQAFGAALQSLEVESAVKTQDFDLSSLHAAAIERASLMALAEFKSEFDTALRFSSAGTVAMTRPLFQRWLHDAASDIHVGTQSSRIAAVRLVEVRELVGAEFFCVWLGGVVEGRFPGREATASLFSEEDKRRVNQALRREVFRIGAGDLEKRIPYRMAEDRLFLFHALNAATQKVCVSYARHGSNGKEQLPSPFVAELQRLSSKAIRHVPTLSVPSWKDVASENMLRQRAALDALARPEFRNHDNTTDRETLNSFFRNEPWFSEAALMKQMDDERLLFFSNTERQPADFSGLLRRPEAVAFLRRKLAFDAQKPVSASQLGQFALCSYKGFLSYVLGLRDEEQPGEEIDARGLGLLWHFVLEKLFGRLKEEGLLGKKVSEIPKSFIDVFLTDVFREFGTKAHLGHPALMGIVKARTRNMLKKVLQSDHGGLPFDGCQPVAAELVFGKATSPKEWQEIVLPATFDGETDIYLTGSLDRLDKGPNRLGILDYKLKDLRASSLAKEILETSFQMPLYLLAAQKGSEGASVSGGWLSLKSGEFISFDDVAASMESNVSSLLSTDREVRLDAKEAGELNLGNSVFDLVSKVRTGDVSPRPKDCDFCPYQPVCRISKRRISQEASDE